MAAKSTFPKDSFGDRVWNALKSWDSTDQELNTLPELYLYREVQRVERATPRQATNTVLRNGINALAELYEQDAKLLESRFMDGDSIQSLANRLNIADSTVYTKQRLAVERLVQALEVQEAEASKAQKSRQHQRPDAATYQKLIGADSSINQLLELVTTTDSPFLISLEGMGGIGKTSLAHRLLYEVIERGLYADVGWISAQHQFLNFHGDIEAATTPALTAAAMIERLLNQLLTGSAAAELSVKQQLQMLQTLLKEQPHLIVIDNLETLVDVEELLPTLQKLANPSRFILTSRVSINSRIRVFPFKVQLLSKEDSLDLIRYEAGASNLPELAAATDEELLPIFNLVGGNPLAIRLVIGQHHTYTLDEILTDLVEVNHTAAQNLYRYIYQKAWASLSKASQKVLSSMTFANPNGDEIEVLSEISGLSAQAIRKELNHLVRLNLIDARGGINDRRYSIHALTRTFLHETVLSWIENEDDSAGQDNDSAEPDDE